MNGLTISDARKVKPKFDILRHGPKGYIATPAVKGWLASTVFGRQFQLVRQTDPLGHPLFVVNVNNPMLRAVA